MIKFLILIVYLLGLLVSFLVCARYEATKKDKINNDAIYAVSIIVWPFAVFFVLLAGWGELVGHLFKATVRLLTPKSPPESKDFYR